MSNYHLPKFKKLSVKGDLPKYYLTLGGVPVGTIEKSVDVLGNWVWLGAHLGETTVAYRGSERIAVAWALINS